MPPLQLRRNVGMNKQAHSTSSIATAKHNSALQNLAVGTTITLAKNASCKLHHEASHQFLAKELSFTTNESTPSSNSAFKARERLLGFGAFLDRRWLEQIAVVPCHFNSTRFCQQGHAHGNDRWDNQRDNEGDHAVLRIETFRQDKPIKATDELALHNDTTDEDSGQSSSTADQCTRASRTFPRDKQHGANSSRAQ